MGDPVRQKIEIPVARGLSYDVMELSPSNQATASLMNSKPGSHSRPIYVKKYRFTKKKIFSKSLKSSGLRGRGYEVLGKER